MMQDEATVHTRPLSLWWLTKMRAAPTNRPAPVMYVAGWTDTPAPARPKVDGQPDVRDGPTLVVSQVQIEQTEGFEGRRVSDESVQMNQIVQYVVDDRSPNMYLKLIAPGGVGGLPKVWVDGEWKDLSGAQEIPRRIAPKARAAAVGRDDVVIKDPETIGVATTVPVNVSEPEPAVEPATTTTQIPGVQSPVTVATTSVPSPSTTAPKL